MRILLINSVCGIRSTGRIVTDIAERYIAAGHECVIAYGRENVPDKYRSITYRICSELEVKKNALYARLRDNEGFNAEKETKRFLKWAMNYDPDVLWLHNLHGYYINIEMLFNWIKSRPKMKVKWTLHDCWALTGHCSHFDFIGCTKWKSLCCECPQITEYPKSIFCDRSIENYQNKQKVFCGVSDLTIITPSYWLKGLVKESFLKEYPVKVEHNTIDKTLFVPIQGNFKKKYGLENKIIVLGVASAWTEKKGINDFIKLASLLDHSYRVVMVGLTAKQIKSMPDEILCIERTNSTMQLAEIYTAADVFVNLTYEDNYPTVNLEALACGTPCLTYRTGGSVESVNDDCVIEQGDLDGIVKKIFEIVEKGKQ